MPVGLPLPANNFKISVQTTPIAPQGAPIGVGSTTGGTVAAATYYGKATALNAAGESIGSVEAAPVTTTGATSSIAWSWPAVLGATSYRLYVGTVTNTQTSYFASATTTVTQTTSAGTAGTIPTQAAQVYAPISLMNSFDVSAAENVATFDVFDTDDPITFQGKQRRTLTVAGYLADSTDTGQALLFTAAAQKWVVNIRMLWDGTTNGFVQQVRVGAYKGSARAGNQPIDISFDFFPGTAAGTIIGTGPLL